MKINFLDRKNVFFLINDKNNNDPNHYCNQPHSLLNILLSLLLIAGIIASYLPQYLKIIHNKSSNGISSWYMFSGMLAASSNLLNAFILQWPYFKCIYLIGIYGILNLMGFLQLSSQWLMFSLIFMAFINYYPEERKFEHHQRQQENEEQGELRERDYPKITSEYLFIIKVSRGILIFFILTFFLSLFLIYIEMGWNLLAMLLGLVSSILSLIQFIPQIWYCWRNRDSIRILSIRTMLMQTPGSFLLCWTIASSPGTKWSTWFSYAIGGILQGILLATVIWRKYFEKQAEESVIFLLEDNSIINDNERNLDQENTNEKDR